MEGYLSQIATRSNANASVTEVNPVVGMYMSPGSAVEDPFEKTEFSGALSSPASAPAIDKDEGRKIMDVQVLNEEKTNTNGKEEPEPVLPSANYLNRHIVRIVEETQQHLVTRIEEKPGISEERMLPVTPISLAGDAKTNISNTHAKEMELPDNRQTVGTTELPNLMAPDLGTTLGDKITSISPASKQETRMKMELKKKESPKLTIGKITIEVLPPAKQQVIEKIEKRTIIESRPNSTQIHSRRIFGLGQM